MAIQDITVNHFDKLTGALLKIDEVKLEASLKARGSQLSELEVVAVRNAFKALNAYGEELSLLCEAWFDKVVELYSKASTNREFGFIQWADCCFEASLRSAA
jgi:hypothetical protein